MMEIQSQLMENISSLNLTFYNGSFTIHYQPPNLNTSVLVIFLIVYTAVVLVGIGGNIVVCFTIFKMKSCTVTNFFMANLASSDILMAAICIPFTILSNLVFHYWAFGAAMCPIVGFLQVTSVLQRAFTLVVITYDQHQMVWHPLRERFRKRNARVLICILWFCAAIASLPVAMYASIVEFPKDEGTIGICMENWEDPSQKRLYSVIIMILQYFLPLAIMTVCYTHIGFIIWLKKMPGEIDRTRDHNQLKSKKRTVRMLVTVVIVYALSWLPLHTLTLIGDTYPEIYDMPNIDVMWMFFHWLAFSSTGLNPIIFFRCNADFRKSFFRLLWCLKNRPTHVALRTMSISQCNKLTLAEND